jgi:hypothetical protein
MGDSLAHLRDLVAWLYSIWPFLLLTLAMGFLQWLGERKQSAGSRYHGAVAPRKRPRRAVSSGIRQRDQMRIAVADEPVDQDALAALRSLGFTKAAALEALRMTCSESDVTTADRVLRVLRADPDGMRIPSSRP